MQIGNKKVNKLIQCKTCGEIKPHQAKGMCFNCYKKLKWQPKNKICKRCGRSLPHHAKGLCVGCYQTVFRLDNNKAWNHMKNYNLDYETYKKITKKCAICGFDKVVDLHHLDQDKKNNSKENLIGLCPNHHKMLHTIKYRKEIFKLLREKGYNPTERKLSEDIKGSY
ncbi:MAG: hypothetical protein ACOCUU_00550 [Nanoarchaeota archaeon]